MMKRLLHLKLCLFLSLFLVNCAVLFTIPRTEEERQKHYEKHDEIASKTKNQMTMNDNYNSLDFILDSFYFGFIFGMEGERYERDMLESYIESNPGHCDKVPKPEICINLDLLKEKLG